MSLSAGPSEVHDVEDDVVTALLKVEEKCEDETFLGTHQYQVLQVAQKKSAVLRRRLSKKYTPLLDVPRNPGRSVLQLDVD